MKVVEWSDPYYHSIIDDFLPEEDFQRISDIYSELTFREIGSDLFQFLQTFELKDYETLDFFRDALDRVFEEKIKTLFTKPHDLDPEDQTTDLNKSKESVSKISTTWPPESKYYTTFASYYREGDYLLCHDDLIDDRLYAYTYYLDDYDSGQLTIYEKDCKTVNKKVDVRKNRLVIFKVGATSFHEVLNCEKSGRKAFTGWLNIKNLKVDEPIRSRKLKVPDNVEYYELPIELNDDCICLDFEDIQVEEISRTVSSPFNDRRCMEITLGRLLVPRFEGYRLVNAEYISIPQFGYILANDRINDELDGVLDVFVLVKGQDDSDFICYVEKTGEIIQKIGSQHGCMFIIQRNGRGMIIPRQTSIIPSEFKHFIYYKND